MIRKKLLLFFLVIFFGKAFCQYITPGTGINWTLFELADNSSGAIIYEEEIYYILENITVSYSDTITIFTDETVKLSSDVLFEVLGVAIFNPPESVLFTAIDTLQTYNGFRIDNSDFSVFQNCTFEFGNGIKIIQSDMYINQCVFRKNNNNYATGILDLYQSNPLISNCVFSKNAGSAVLSAANSNSAPEIINNIIFENVTTNINMPQINLGSCLVNDTIKIIGNNITGFYDNSGGIAVSLLAGGDLNCIIKENTINHNRYGITVYGNNIFSHISNNVITDNNIQGDPYLGGSGINFWGNNTNVSIVEGNIISGNLWGITVQNEAMPDMGNVDNQTSSGFNMIYENENEGETYALYNNTPNDLNAQNNFWGSNDPDIVESYIFHYPDNNSLGVVNYLPFWDTISSIQENHIEASLIDNIYPIPFDQGLHIDFNIDDNESLFIYVYDVFGKIRKEFVSEIKDISLEVSDLESGIYFLEIRNAGSKEVIKIQK